MKIEKKNLQMLLIVAVILIAGIGIGYAALSTTLTITFGNVTQTALTWNVGFDTTGSPISATAAGTSSTGRVCGTATVTATTVTVADTQLSKPDDKCTYALTIKNTGTIPAKLSSINPTKPSGITCNTASGANLVCGNITYKLTTNTGGTTLLTTGGTLAASSGSLPVYLVVTYTGTTLNSSAVVQSGASFTLTYDQA